MFTPTGEGMIQVESLTRWFGSTVALQDLTFSVAPGEVVGFLGPNGAGKTTAMRILTGSLAPTSGWAVVGGHDVLRESLAVRSLVGFMPENVPLYPDNTVQEFLHFVGRVKGVPANRLRSQVSEIMELAALAEVRQRLIGHLSKGFRQRVGLAQALIGDPSILILDEPSAGLDPHQIVEVRELIRSFRGVKTVLLSSHILNEVSLVCQRVLILDRGRLVAEQSPEVLAETLGKTPRIVLVWRGAREEVLSALARQPGVQEVVATEGGAEVLFEGNSEEIRPCLAETVLGAGGRLQVLQERIPSLEDLFLRVTGEEGGQNQ
jgi:ABC-2 type transport system ATP-binding protein